MGISYSHMAEDWRPDTSADDRLDDLTRRNIERVESERAVERLQKEIEILRESNNALIKEINEK